MPQVKLVSVVQQKRKTVQQQQLNSKGKAVSRVLSGAGKKTAEKERLCGMKSAPRQGAGR